MKCSLGISRSFYFLPGNNTNEGIKKNPLTASTLLSEMLSGAGTADTETLDIPA